MVLPGSLHARLVAVTLLILCTATTACAAVFVNCNAPSGGDGTTWGTAFQRIQQGVNAATTSNSEVWVAAGRYTENVTLRTGVGIYGGFAGTESRRFQRSPVEHVTIIDGNRAGNVIVGADRAIVDGFTITNGKPATSGGGVYCSYVSPTISNCKITANTGNGIYCYQSTPTIVNCEITANTDKGIYCAISGNATITGCLIANNAAVQYAGIHCNSARPTIRRCVVTGNYTTGTDARGGGMAFISCSSVISVENCLISGNSAAQGGGVYCSGSSPSFVHCTISGNSAGISGGNIYLSYSSPALRNTIVAHGVAPIGGAAYKSSTSIPVFAACDFWSNGQRPFEPVSWNPSTGNLALDPLFVGLQDGNYRLSAASLCIDAGSNEFALKEDLDGYLRPNGSACDIGAYEYAQISSSSNNTVLEAKLRHDGENITIPSGVVSGTFDGFFYVEQADRTSGIRVQWPGQAPDGWMVSVTGTLETRGGVERQIRADRVTIVEPAGVKPLGLSSRSIGGSSLAYAAGPPASGQMGRGNGLGPNNIGLLVRAWGRIAPVTVSGGDVAVIDSLGGIMLDLPPDVPAPAEGRFVRISGICSLSPVENGAVPVILVRNSSDIVLVD